LAVLQSIKHHGSPLDDASCDSSQLLRLSQLYMRMSAMRTYASVIVDVPEALSSTGR